MKVARGVREQSRQFEASGHRRGDAREVLPPLGLRLLNITLSSFSLGSDIYTWLR